MSSNHIPITPVTVAPWTSSTAASSGDMRRVSTSRSWCPYPGFRIAGVPERTVSATRRRAASVSRVAPSAGRRGGRWTWARRLGWAGWRQAGRRPPPGRRRPSSALHSPNVHLASDNARAHGLNEMGRLTDHGHLTPHRGIRCSCTCGRVTAGADPASRGRIRFRQLRLRSAAPDSTVGARRSSAPHTLGRSSWESTTLRRPSRPLVASVRRRPGSGARPCRTPCSGATVRSSARRSG
jgi:hypothetical protein